METKREPNEAAVASLLRTEMTPPPAGIYALVVDLADGHEVAGTASRLFASRLLRVALVVGCRAWRSIGEMPPLGWGHYSLVLRRLARFGRWPANGSRSANSAASSMIRRSL